MTCTEVSDFLVLGFHVRRVHRHLLLLPGFELTNMGAFELTDMRSFVPRRWTQSYQARPNFRLFGRDSIVDWTRHGLCGRDFVTSSEVKNLKASKKMAVHTVEHDPSIKSQLASRFRFWFMWTRLLR